MARERVRVLYSGRVQGVGFRFTARRLAPGFAVSGYVRNLPDGRVELVAEGEPAALDGFLGAIRAELGDRIHAAHADREPAGQPPLEGFSIRY